MSFSVPFIVFMSIAVVLAVAGIAYRRIGNQALKGKRQLGPDITPSGMKKISTGMFILCVLVTGVAVALVI